MTSEQRKAYMRAYYLAHKDEMNAKFREYHAAHREEHNTKALARRNENKEASRSASRKWNAEHPEAHRATNSRWRDAHRDELRGRRLAYHAEHKEKRNAAHRAWSKAHPENGRSNRQLRRARLQGSVGTHTLSEVSAQFEIQSGRCFYCATPLFDGTARKYHEEHLMPLCRGGTNDISNIVCACATCNTKKGTKMPSDFYRQFCAEVIS